MAAGGMAPDIESAGISAESGGVFVGPCNSVAHLLRHDANITLCRADKNEIENDKVDPGVDEKFGRKSIVFCFAAPPGAAVHKHKDRRIRRLGWKHIERFDRRRTVTEALWLTQP